MTTTSDYMSASLVIQPPVSVKLTNQQLIHGNNVHSILHSAVVEKVARLRFSISREHTFNQIDQTPSKGNNSINITNHR